MGTVKEESEKIDLVSGESTVQKNTIIEESDELNNAENGIQEQEVPVDERAGVKAKRVSLATVTYDLHDDLSTICVLRQYELFKSPTMNEGSDILVATNSAGAKSKIQILGSETKDDVFWLQVIEQYSDIIKEKKTALLEEKLAEGIPEHLRSSVYLEVTRAKYKFHKESFDSLSKQANHESPVHISLQKDKTDTQYDSISKVFNYYTTKVSPKNVRNSDRESSTSIFEYFLPPNNFVLHVGQVLSTIPNLENEEVFFLMLKFKKIFDVLIKGEFFYKIDRSIEEVSPELLEHIGKQGISLSTFYKKYLFTYFSDKLNSIQLLQITDFIIFEGFDFILRLLVHQFKEHRERLLEMSAEEITSFLDSEAFFDNDISLSKVLEVQPDLVKYENEYHLIHANSFNKNDNELSNLVEVNDELQMRISELKHHLENLSISHKEILSQTNEYNIKLSNVSKTRADLDSLNSQLQEKYEQLTMEQNVKNTIKANEDFSQRNQELERQIADVKKSIETRAKRLEVS